jgi:four helix bundle protein
VGANLEEGVGAQTKPDFIAKQFVALKEARETRFWLRLIAVSEPSLEPKAKPLIAEASELVAILTASLKTARSTPNRGQYRPNPKPVSRE